MQNEKSKTLDTKAKSALRYIGKNTPVWAFVAIALAILAMLVRLACRLSSSFADFFVRYIAGGVRFLMASASNVFFFSIAEIIIIISPLICAFLIYLAVRFSKNKRRAYRYAVTILSVIALLYFHEFCHSVKDARK